MTQRYGAGPAGLKFETSGLQDLISVAGLPPTRGTHRRPVVGFKMVGVGVRDAAITYMEPHSIPSGGDWGLQRMAAVFFENTVGSTIENCIFERNDGEYTRINKFTVLIWVCATEVLTHYRIRTY